MSEPVPRIALNDLGPEALRAIDEDLARWDSGSELLRLFEAGREKWDAIVRTELEAIRASERLTADDLSIRINPID